MAHLHHSSPAAVPEVIACCQGCYHHLGGWTRCAACDGRSQAAARKPEPRRWQALCLPAQLHIHLHVVVAVATAEMLSGSWRGRYMQDKPCVSRVSQGYGNLVYVCIVCMLNVMALT